jgi:hypothetical protein
MKNCLFHACAAIAVVSFIPTGSRTLLAAPLVILDENFDAYADQMAFANAWMPDGVPSPVLEPAFGHPGQCLKLLPTDGNGLTNRWFRDLDRSFVGTDAEPLVFSYDLYLDPAGEAMRWDGAWHSVGVRGYEGGGYGQGSLHDLLHMGVAERPNGNPDWFQARLQAKPWLAPDALGYFDLKGDYSTPRRTAGWHRLAAVVTGSQVRFTVDGTLIQVIEASLGFGINTVLIGDGLPADGYTVWVDNIRVEIVPEPGTALLLAAGAVVLARVRRRSEFL